MMAGQLNSEERLDRFCRLLHEAIGIPILRTDQTGQILGRWPDEFPLNPYYNSLQEQMEQWIRGHSPESVPMLCSTSFLEHFFVLPLQEEGRIVGWLMLGPVKSAVWPETLLTGLLQENKIPSRLHPAWLTYYRSLLVMEQNRLRSSGMLALEWIIGESLNPADVMDHSRQSADQSKIQTTSLRLSGNREAGVYHHSPDAEKLLMKHIQSGNRQELFRAFTVLAEQGVGFLSKRSPLRHQKNIAITAITLATRAAMEGGMFPEEAYTLSDVHIQHIEDLGEVSKVENALLSALDDFADGVKQGLDQRVSRPIALCQRYIFDHLYKELSLPILAKASGVSPAHLSRLFRRETGCSLTEYIQQQRVKEAKQLLSLSAYSLSDIATRLQFHDQSYFTKVFKKYAGVTPKQYRHRRLDTSASDG
jgi:AraC-like DNA-binding protein